MNAVSRYVTEVWSVIHATIRGVWVQLDEGKIIRRGVLLLAAYIQYKTVMWSMNYVTNLPPDIDSIASAAMVAAILTPASALFASAIKFYNDTRNKEKGIH